MPANEEFAAGTIGLLGNDVTDARLIQKLVLTGPGQRTAFWMEVLLEVV
jgi:hypothetical protein